MKRRVPGLEPTSQPAQVNRRRSTGLGRAQQRPQQSFRRAVDGLVTACNAPAGVGTMYSPGTSSGQVVIHAEAATWGSRQYRRLRSSRDTSP